MPLLSMIPVININSKNMCKPLPFIHVYVLQVVEVREWLEPLFVKVLSTVQPDTADDWYQCFSEISVSCLSMHVLSTCSWLGW